MIASVCLHPFLVGFVGETQNVIIRVGSLNKVNSLIQEVAPKQAGAVPIVSSAILLLLVK